MAYDTVLKFLLNFYNQLSFLSSYAISRKIGYFPIKISECIGNMHQECKIKSTRNECGALFHKEAYLRPLHRACSVSNQKDTGKMPARRKHFCSEINNFCMSTTCQRFPILFANRCGCLPCLYSII